MAKNRVVIFLGEDVYNHKGSFIQYLSDINPRNIPLLREYKEIEHSFVVKQDYVDSDVISTAFTLLSCRIEGFNILIKSVGGILQFEMLLSSLEGHEEVAELVVVKHKSIPLSLQDMEIVKSCSLNNIMVHCVSDYIECDYLRNYDGY